ncbi:MULTISPECIES: Holliday junction resolvase RecU [unclassified Enterococcus]|jgi:recombination protein U|uniref:Holliday junction resolvase RecU n=1 Tax=unclassified Enterococcus TaxID=2608891 RepID=UPI0006B8930B|nr:MULTISPECIES: Holliday junction resolvase RecU [unclassified Enterococcus]KPG71657.1 Holliday junction endonuclease [Enterococcus sp. RIT-PI-f]HCE13173.1 Holliday junction resolvase RecU [Enterococcus sp.]
MVIRYPNGQSSTYDGGKKQKMQEKAIRPKTFANRGMRFEEAINESNLYYLNRQIAVIHKKPTPIQIVKVDYPRRSAAVIKEAYFREASTTDYNGVYRGHYLDFEAKETQNKTSFPFKNFHLHQIKHMENCLEQKGLCFVLLWFSSLQRCFFLDSRSLIEKWYLQDSTGKKSLPLSYIERAGIEINPKIAPRIPYLEAVDSFLTIKENE